MSRTHPRRFLGFFEWFVRSEASGSILLLGCTVVALAWANSPWAAGYDRMLHTYAGLGVGDGAFKLSLHHWVNDGLMVLFFFVVGLEIKRELVVGRLASLREATLPLAAAVGGMVVPAVLYAVVNVGGDGAAGWGVPMATDIAFALGVLALFGRRVPIELKVFLTALAIVDDLGAVLVIALFYTASIQLVPLLAAAILLATLMVVVRLGFDRLWVVVPLALGVWLGVFASGVHATVAGVLVALVIPVRARVEPEHFLAAAKERLDRLQGSALTRQSMIDDRGQLDDIEGLHEITARMLPPGLVLEHALHPVQVWLVLPLFALFNAGVPLEGASTGATGPVSLGILLGLVAGKPLGILLASWLAVRSGRASLPAGVSWGQVIGAGCLAGIGFTMSLFITDLAFDSLALETSAKIGILGASLLSAIGGAAILHRSLPAR